MPFGAVSLVKRSSLTLEFFVRPYVLVESGTGLKFRFKVSRSRYVRNLILVSLFRYSNAAYSASGTLSGLGSVGPTVSGLLFKTSIIFKE